MSMRSSTSRTSTTSTGSISTTSSLRFADDASTWATTRPAWVAFVEELADELHATDRTLTISIPPVWDVTIVDGEVTASAGYWVYDHGAIAAHADAIRLMAYDYSVAEPGPISPLPWVQNAVDGTSAVVPEEYHDKLVLGVPSYGSNWVVSTVGECPASAEGRTNVTARSVNDLAGRVAPACRLSTRSSASGRFRTP